VELIAESTGSLDGLVNNAGVGMGGPLVELADEALYEQFEVNVFWVFRVTKAFFPMLLQRSGSIVIIGSITGFFTAPFIGPYSMSKRAVEGFADALRRELDPLGVRVALVEAGNVKTPLWDKTEALIKEPGQRFSPLFRDRAVRIVEKIIREAQRNGMMPMEVAKSVHQALHAEKPKPRYMMEGSSLGMRVLRRLPDRVVDLVFRKM
jgi:NAD(P)-dependent dehydrogenase (short-subunit alcohol dehydrogenase family)